MMYNTSVKCPFETEECGFDKGPHVATASLGSCAVVGSSPSLLGRGLGRVIDAHDTVIRFGNLPVQGFETDVGSRTTVAYVHIATNELKTLNNWTSAHEIGSVVSPSKFWIFEVPRLPPVQRHSPTGRLKWARNMLTRIDWIKFDKLGHHDLPLVAGKPAVVINSFAKGLKEGMAENEFEFYEPMRFWYRLIKEAALKATPRTVHIVGSKDKFSSMPTDRMVLTMSLLYSGLCERVDLYGFPDTAGDSYSGKALEYDAEENRVRVEQALFRLLMTNGTLCTYDTGLYP